MTEIGDCPPVAPPEPASGAPDGEKAAIREANGESDLTEVRILLEEYAGSLGIDLEFQGFARELAELPGAYTRPDGLLLIAAIGTRPVGCVAVRRLELARCEMKRLYVRDEARGHGVGRGLAETAIHFARGAGYRTMVLDTLPTMAAAQVIYRRLGFVDVPPYRYNPVAGTAFMELTIEARPGPNPDF